MKILFIAMQSIHTSRWINQLRDSNHKIYLIDALDRPINDNLRWTIYYENWSKRKIPYIKGEYRFSKTFPSIYSNIEPILKVTASEKIYNIIQHIKPDLVHSLQMQSESYPLIKVSKKINFNWAYFSWGSDLFLYQNHPKHRNKIVNALKNIKFFFADNHRDLKIARQLGYTGKFSYIFPGGGGYNISEIQKNIKPINQRDLILIKGYEHWAGKALKVLEALELIIKHIRPYKIYVFSAHQPVVDKIKYLNNTYNINIQFSTNITKTPHDELLKLFGKALIYIGNSISDGIPNTLLEAIISGAFPIQSNPGGVTEEYITDGENGFLIQNPLNVDEISKKIILALNNRKLLNQAYKINALKIAKRLDSKIIKDKVLDAYSEIEKELQK